MLFALTIFTRIIIHIDMSAIDMLKIMKFKIQNLNLKEKTNKNEFCT